MFDPWTLSVGATVATLSCLITIIGRDPSVPLDWFDLIVLLLAALPYVGAICLSDLSDFLRAWSRFAVTTYGVLDIYIRAEATWFPQGSTAGIAMVTLPFTGAPAAFLISAGAAAVFRGARSTLTDKR